MFTETDLYPKDVTRNAVRWIVSRLDKAVFALLTIVYQLFFSVASADIFSSGVITKFYQRVQLIIGIFVLFQLAMTILRGIVNPDSFTDSKSGAENLVIRICTALIMLSLIVPINIPSASNEFEKQINNNGLLFGTLYSLQHRILSNNTIGKVVMGTGNNDGDANYMNGTDNASFKQAANIFTATIVKGFYRINLIPEADRKTPSGMEDDQVNNNRVCKDIDNNVLNEYKKIDANPGTIIDFVNETCSIDSELQQKYSINTGLLTGKSLYVFTFMPVVSTVIGVIFVLILLSFCVDVAVRAIKLAILRLIAPIPIISYMDPKGGKDGSFNAWVKALTSTYLDLFIRIAAVYFVIYMIQQMLVNGITTSSTGALKTFTVIFIWIGLFYFAKEAPKFIKQVLGIKDDGGSGIFSGLGKIVGLGAAVGGVVGSGLASFNSSVEADKTRKAFGQKDIFGRTVDPNRGLNKAKHLVAGIAGGIGGGIAGGAAAMNAKDHRFKNAMEAMQKRNASAISKGTDGSTLFGRIGSSATQYFTGDTSAAALERDINTNKARIDALKAIKSRVSGEMVKSDWTGAEVTNSNGQYLMQGTDSSGNVRSVTGKINYKDFMARKNAASSSGSDNFTVRTSTGEYTISMEDAERYQGLILKGNENDYIEKHTTAAGRQAITAAGGKIDDRLITLVHSADQIGSVATFTRDENGVITKGKTGSVSNRASVNDTIDALEDYNTQLSRQNSINKANDRYSGKK